MDSMGQAAIDLAQSAGLEGMAWQNRTLTNALAVESGRWKYAECGLIVPRQNGKTWTLSVLALFNLFVARSPVTVWTAHEFKTAMRSFKDLRDIIDGTPHLRRGAKRMVMHGGMGTIELDAKHGGATLLFLARTRSTIRGYSVDTLILDEAFALTEDHMSAMLPTQLAVKNPQRWYASSAPLEDSQYLRQLMRRGRAGTSSRLYYEEHRAPDSADTADRAAWRLANPSYDDIPSMPDVLEGLYESLGADAFRREMMGIVDLSDTSGRAIDPADYAACSDPAPMTGRRPCVVFDVSLDGSHASLYAAAGLEDGRYRVEPVAAWPNVADMRADLPGWLRRIRPAKVGWFPNGPSAAVAADIGQIPNAEAIRGDVPGVCMGFADLIESHQLAHSDDPLLGSQLLAAERYVSGDVWRFTRRAGNVDAVYAAAGAVYLARSMTRARKRTAVIVAK